MSIDRLPGFLDHRPEESIRFRRVSETLRQWFETNGYQSVTLPVLEPTDLYARKSGGSLLTKLYSFVDPGGHKVSLRPEFTASAVRCYLDERATGTAQTVRWHYDGPIFRYEPATSLRQTYQSGVECFGEGGPVVDAGLVALALSGLTRIGVANIQVVLGHVGLFTEAIAGFGLSDRTISTILSAIPALRLPGGTDALRERLVELGLTASDPEAAALKQALSGLGDDGARIVVRGLLESINIDLLGGREPEEIVGRLLRKLAGWDDPANIDPAIDLARRLAAVAGSPDEAAGRARSLLAERGIVSRSLNELEETLQTLSGLGSQVSQIDFGLTRDLGYYSGLVFELRAGDGTVLGGGGRYDGLVRAIGGVDVPAAGFAFGVERLVAASRLAAPSAAETARS